MINNFLTSMSIYGEKILEYLNQLYQYPIKLVSLVLDLTIVVLVLVKLIKLAKNSKVMQLIKGIVIVILATWLSDILHLTIVHSVLMAILPSGVVALIVIFQPEIRRA